MSDPVPPEDTPPKDDDDDIWEKIPQKIPPCAVCGVANVFRMPKKQIGGHELRYFCMACLAKPENARCWI